MENSKRILIIDKDSQTKNILHDIYKGWDITQKTSLDKNFESTHVKAFDAAIVDLPEEDENFNEFKTILEKLDSTPVIITGETNLWNQISQSLEAGAFDYLKKPLDKKEIKRSLGYALDTDNKQEKKSCWELIGCSQKIRDIFLTVKKVAPTESTILIQGESGTGKELIARALHNNSLRYNQSFVSVNCGAFTSTLLESELFGHIKGSFTGADKDKKGLVDVAHKGTFFLDEISEMPLELQVKLLRLLEEREFIPVGANKAIKVDVRFICATNKNLQDEVKKKNFREDLFYRLNVIPILLPPLREREGDVIDIAKFFIKRYTKKISSSIKGISSEVEKTFLTYTWPGNVRELENTIQRALALANPESSQIEFDTLEERIRQTQTSHMPIKNPVEIPKEGLNLSQFLENLEYQYILKALEKTQGNKTQAAKLLGMKLRSFTYKVEKFKIPPHLMKS